MSSLRLLARPPTAYKPPTAASLTSSIDVRFQRIGDLAWAAGDTAPRLPDGGTAGRTTLNGERVCSTRMATAHILASTNP